MPPPAIFYLDDVYIVNEQDHYLVMFYATFFAITALDTEAHLVGNPPLYQPLNPSPWVLIRFRELSLIFYDHLATILEATSANQQ